MECFSEVEMIKSKKCSECDRPVFSKGLCQLHSKDKSIPKGSNKIKQKRDKTAEKNTIKKEIIEVYFDYHIERCTRSEESFKQISNPTRANICHIIPKGLHPSVQDNLENCVYYLFEEHERFDKLLFSLEFEKLEKEFKNSWDKICTRAKYVLSLCQESTNLSREFKKYLDGREIKS
jgi:hypothetical protein